MKSIFKNWYKNPLFLFHVVSHLSIIPMILYADIFHWLITIIFYHIYGCFGIAITYHRLLAHRSFKASKLWHWIGSICGTLAAVGSTIEWCIVHRKHHKYSDSDKDPHNPKIFGFINTQMFTMLITKSEQTYSNKFAIDLLKSNFHKSIHKYYWLIHASYFCILLTIDPFLIISAYLVPCAILWQVMSALGTFAHSDNFGYKNYKNSASNLWLLGYGAFGEGWHNNHHEQASNSKFGLRWWELDLSNVIINFIKSR